MVIITDAIHSAICPVCYYTIRLAWSPQSILSFLLYGNRHHSPFNGMCFVVS